MDYNIASSFNPEDNIWMVDLTGEFDIFNSTELKDALNRLANENNSDLSLNCAKLTFLDSTAIGSLVAVLKNVKGYDGTIKLVNLRPSLYKLFKITNLDKVFEIVGDNNG